MSSIKVVFESFDQANKSVLKNYIRKSIPVYFLEPFVAYHKKKSPFHGFSNAFPGYVEQFLREGTLELLSANLIEAKTIYRQATDKAVDVIESVFPEYKKEHEEVFEYVSDTLKSSVAMNIFKKDLCSRLAEFYSVNIMLYRVGKLLGPEPILFYPDTNVRSYQYLKSLLSKCRQDFFGHPDISFPAEIEKAALLEDIREYAAALLRLTAQTAVSSVFSVFPVFPFSSRKNKRDYSYGVSIISPARQLSENRRGPDFIVDNSKIYPRDVVYLPLAGLSGEHKKCLSEIPGDVYYPPGAGRCFSHFSKWRRLLSLALKKNSLFRHNEINTACNVFFNYFRWQKVLRDVKLSHFITHCDYGISHIGRNIALKQAGIQTWYFTDSMNHGCNWKTKTAEDKCGMRHPFWTYLYYDHFVTWDGLIAEYFSEHPCPIKNTHIVGCLWSGHIKDIKNAGEKSRGNAGKKFVLSVFDSTYSRNGITSYAEGVAFAEHILKLADDCPDINIFIKEKKERNIHRVLDPVLGPRLLEIYSKMDSHPRITVCSHGEDASALISASDMVISFPFTSTTFEALSVNKPAVWHDPLGYYRNTPYAEAGEVTTHSYEELKLKVLEIKSVEHGAYQNPVPIASPLMDPYRDGKAIDRFRELLCSQGEKVKQYTHPVCVTENE